MQLVPKMYPISAHMITSFIIKEIKLFFVTTPHLGFNHLDLVVATTSLKFAAESTKLSNVQTFLKSYNCAGFDDAS
jgi:hypothetical protein